MTARLFSNEFFLPKNITTGEDQVYWVNFALAMGYPQSENNNIKEIISIASRHFASRKLNNGLRYWCC